MKRQLSKSEVKDLNAELAGRFGQDVLDKKDRIETCEKDCQNVLLVNNAPAFVMQDGRYVPHLRFLLVRPSVLRHVTVDMGAVRFVTAGADVMRPGITAIDDGIKQGDFVLVIDQNHKKPLAVCEALFGAEEMRAMPKGKVLRTIHYVGDALWKTEF